MFEHIKQSRQLETISEILTAINDPARQQIIMLFMQKNEFCVTEIANNFKISRPTVSHHLNLMRRAKVLNSRKDGKEVFYSFNKEYVLESLGTIIDYLKGCC